MQTKRSRVDRPRAGQAGMTLIEVLVALVILAGSLVAMGNFMGKFTHTQRQASLRADEMDIATDLVDSVQHAATYAAVPSYAGTVTQTRDNATFTRVTLAKQIGGGVTSTTDYYIITTKVSTVSIPDTVKKTFVIASF